MVIRDGKEGYGPDCTRIGVVYRSKGIVLSKVGGIFALIIMTLKRDE